MGHGIKYSVCRLSGFNSTSGFEEYLEVDKALVGMIPLRCIFLWNNDMMHMYMYSQYFVKCSSCNVPCEHAPPIFPKTPPQSPCSMS